MYSPMVSEMVQYSTAYIHIQQMIFIFNKSHSHSTNRIHIQRFTFNILHSHSTNYICIQQIFHSHSTNYICMQQIAFTFNKLYFVFNKLHSHSTNRIHIQQKFNKSQTLCALASRARKMGDSLREEIRACIREELQRSERGANSQINNQSLVERTPSLIQASASSASQTLSSNDLSDKYQHTEDRSIQ